MKAGCLTAGSLFGPLILSTVLSAQTLPVPVLPPEAPSPAAPGAPGAGTAGADAVGGAEPERLRQWEYGLGVGGGWDSNIGFELADGPSSAFFSPRGSLARVFRSLKGLLRVEGSGNWIGYSDQKDLNRYYADLRLEGSYRSSVNTTWLVNGSYGQGYSDSSPVLSDQGVLLPLVRTRTATGTIGVTRKLGARNSFRLEGRVYSAEFDQEDVATLGLVNGRSVRAAVAFERRLGHRDTAAVGYSLERALGREAPDATGGVGRYYLTHFGSFQWTHLLSSRSGLLLEAGGSYTPEALQAGLGQREGFFGGATYMRQVKHSVVTLFARREVTPLFGLGVIRIENRFGVNAAVPIGRAWTLEVEGIHVRPETPEDAAAVYGTPSEVSVILGRRLARRFEISGESRYRHRGPAGTSPAIEAYQVGVYFSLLSPSTRAGRRGP